MSENQKDHKFDLITPSQAAKLSGLGINKIRELCERGVFGVNTSLGNRPTWKIRREDLLNFLTPANRRVQ